VKLTLITKSQVKGPASDYTNTLPKQFPETYKDLVMACHIPPLKKVRYKGKSHTQAQSHPITTFSNGMGLCFGNI